MRRKISFNTRWLYCPKDVKEAYKKNFNESEFIEVSVPHANKILETHKSTDFQTQINSYRFISWYRRHFSADCLGKRVILEFEAVSNIADLYINGVYVGTHKGAYTGFSFDITDHIKKGDNVIALRVNSKKCPDVPPEGGDVDYCLFGGIVRNVNLIITGETYIENTYIKTLGLLESGGKKSRIAVETKILNKSGIKKEYTIETTLFDADKNIVAFVFDKAVTDKEYIFNQISDEIINPHLWTSDDPYLYTVITTIKYGETVTDSYKTKIGFRWFYFNNTETDANFYLNGKKTKIIGVNRHEQWPWIGRAVCDKLQMADADLIKKTGFNTVRCSHYPQSISFLDRCDKIGLMVFEEAPGWQHIGDDKWQELYKENIREMIIRDRNHPSIISWGTRVNESEDNKELYISSNNIAHLLDCSRPTHGVRNEFAIERNSEFLENEDIYAINYQYPGITYSSLTPVHTPYVVTEHSNDWYKNGDNDPNGVPWADDNASIAFMRSFGEVVNAYSGNDLWAGGFAWSMFDYNNEVNYTKTDNVFYSGIYDIFRYPKIAAYLYKSQLDDEPMIYIANNWISPSTVIVMSNCDEAELFVNGKSIIRKKPDLYMNLKHPLYEFSDVEYEKGKITAVGYINGKEAARHTRYTPGAAIGLRLTPDYDTLIADGSDLTSVTIEILDEFDQIIPYADNEIKITVQGDCNFIGEDNIRLEGGRTAFLIQSRYLKSGKIKCSASSDGLRSGKCEIEVLEFFDEEI